MIDGIKGSRQTPGGATPKDEKETPFIPPEKVANSEPEGITKTSTATKPSFTASSKAKKRRSPKQWFSDLSKQKKIIVIVVALLVVIGTGVGVFALTRSSEPVPAALVEEEPAEEAPKATPVFSPLTGVVVSKEQSEYPITGVMIENSPDARPQSGLNEAGVVFEAIAEGGITRFLALYQEARPEYVGPVRSVRPYYLDWMLGFDAAIAHVGGSAEALNRIKSEGIKDLDQFANSSAYNRVSNRYAPHNMYTNLATLLSVQQQKGWAKSTFTGFPRKPEAPSTAINAKSIDITISGNLYNVHYDYDPASNSYKRVLAGKPHTDERSKAQISPKVVVAMVVPFGRHPNGVNSQYGTIGSGKTYVFQDGIATEGTWEKASTKAQIVFKDAAGVALPFNAGQTWITATSIATNVNYKP